MEARKITVLETRNQKKSEIMSTAETLAELKADLRANNIDYRDMAFYEGTAKVELVSDDSALPKDVMYKGRVTNELVFMLSTMNKKIKSGAKRSELYEVIKEQGLQKACLDKFNKNYTMCSNEQLEEVIEENKKETVYGYSIDGAFRMLVEHLYSKNLIDTDVYDCIFELINAPIEEVKPLYTDEEIDEMFKDFLN